MPDFENDRGNAKRPLSEISHLFLSGIREHAGENRARPVRLPPQASRPASPAPATMRVVEDVDLTPEEFASVYGRPVEPASVTVGGDRAESVARRRRVTAVIGASVQGESLGDAALAYAASLAAGDERIGVLTIDGGEFRMQCVACDAGEDFGEDAEPSDRMDARAAGDALVELNHDVDRWLLVLPDPRRPDARAAMRQADDWTMLSTCDHDGIVGGYRTLKGLAENGEKSPLSIALVDAPDAMQANKVFTKLASVCRQFLDWDVRHEALEADVEHAQVRTVTWMRGEAAHARPLWAAVATFLAMTPDDAANAAHFGEEMPVAAAPAPVAIPRIAQPIAKEETPMTMTMTQPTISPAAPAVKPEMPTDVMSCDDVIELPEGASIQSAVLRAGTQLLTTPIAPPMCPEAAIAVGRDRALVLVAQAAAGLAGVDAIAAAVRWLDESKQLVAMAMPQLAIDAAAPTRVLLLVDQADRAAVAVRPLFAGSDGRVTVRSYRKLRWGGRTGLMLDAA